MSAPASREADRSSIRRLAVAVGLLASLTGLATLGYMAIEGLGFADALYMTVITLSTVGYREVTPLHPMGQWFTIAVIVSGIGAVFYTVVALTEFLIEGRLREVVGRRSEMRAIEAMRGHIIVCGLGRLGLAVAERLTESGRDLVVIDPSPEAAVVCRERSFPHVPGSALDEQVLRQAGIERAQGLVAAIGNEPDNVFLTLSAREANPDLDVHARAESTVGARRLHQAGAAQVISPYQLGGQRIANAIVRPAVVEFLELSSPGKGVEVDLEEIALAADGTLVGKSLAELDRLGPRVVVVAIKRSGGLSLHPTPDDVLEAGDRVIVVGDSESLAHLAELAHGVR